MIPNGQRRHYLTAYGTDVDVEKLNALSKYLGRSKSDLLIHLVNEKYNQLFGDVEPEKITT